MVTQGASHNCFIHGCYPCIMQRQGGADGRVHGGGWGEIGAEGESDRRWEGGAERRGRQVWE